jgi:hypothetical protein
MAQRKKIFDEKPQVENLVILSLQQFPVVENALQAVTW